MVFPKGAQIRELAADHLDRLPGKSLVDRLIHESSMTKNGHARSTNQPHQSSNRARKQTQRNRNDEETSVELRASGAESANDQITAIEKANEVHASHSKDDVEEQKRVRDESIDAQHGKDNGIVAGVVAQVVVDARLSLGEVGRLGDALEVEELADGTQVAEATAERTRVEALKAITKVQAGGKGLDRDRNARHDEFVSKCWFCGRRCRR